MQDITGKRLTAQALSQLTEWETELPDDAKRDDVFHAPNAPLDWTTLDSQIPPERQWALDHWLPMGAVTLLAGAAGIGKTLTAQSLSSCLALKREYLELPAKPRKVLFWACEDSRDELWRRQLSIASWLNVPLRDFTENLVLQSYDGTDTEIAGIAKNKLVPTPNFVSLQAQIADYKAEVVILDNIARIYGGDENNRHQVTTFVAMLTRAAAPTGAAVMLLGHPAKAAGSEYSGTTAWEAACRARLYLGSQLPDKPKNTSEEEIEEPDVQYLCRRKSNYSAKDWRRIKWLNGVMVPEIDPRELPQRHGYAPEQMRELVMNAVEHLGRVGVHATGSPSSPTYLPKLAERYQMLNGCSRSAFAKAMRELQLNGDLVVGQVGTYSNRTPKMAFICTSKKHN